MISPEELNDLIKRNFADADVDIVDKTGMSDHFIIKVRSRQFEGVDLMDRHRRVMSCLETVLRDGRLHAAEIKTEVPV